MAFPAILAALGRGAGGAAAFKEDPKKEIRDLAKKLQQKMDNPTTNGKSGLFGSVMPDFLDANSKLSKSFRQLVVDITSPIDAINALGQSITKFTSLSSPGKTALFDLRVKDAYAVVGKAMEPLLDVFTKVAENIGDMFARSGPQLKILFKTIGGAFEKLGAITLKMEPIFNSAVMFMDKLVGSFSRLLGPLEQQNSFWDKFANTISEFIDGIYPVVDFAEGTLDGFITILRDFVEEVINIGDQLDAWEERNFGDALGKSVNKALGFKRGNNSSDLSNPNAKAEGSAVRQAEVVNSADELQRRMATQALTSQGANAGKSETLQVKSVLEDIDSDIKKIVSYAANFSKEVYGGLTEAQREYVEMANASWLNVINNLRMS